MQDQDRSKQQLIEELGDLRRRVEELEASPTGQPQQQRLGDGWWQSFLANTPVFVVVVGRDYRIQFLNRTDSGLPTDGLIGVSLADFVRPEHWDGVRVCVDEVFATGKTSFHQSLTIRPDNQDHWYEGFFGPIFTDGQVAAVSLIATNVNARTQAEQEGNANVGVGKNVTERVRADMARRESERRLLTLISNLPGMAYRCKTDPDWTMEFVSEGCFPLTGYHRSELLRSEIASFGSLIHPEDRQMVWDGVQEAVAKKQHFQFEYRIQTATGEDKWVWEQGTGVYSTGGQVEALEGFITDITERKRAEEALKKTHHALEQRVEERTAELQKANERLQQEVEERRGAEERFAKAFHSNPSPMALGSSDGCFIEVNQAFLLTLGYERGELIGATASELDLFLDPERYKAAASVLRDEGHLKDISLDVRTKNGRVRHGLFSGEVIQLQDQQLMLTVMEDNTERKQAQQTLRQSNDELQTIYDGLIDGLHILNLETLKPVRVNSALCRMMGYSQEEILLLGFSDVHPPEQLPRIQEEFQARFKERAFGWSDVPLVRKDGSIFYADITGSQIVYNGTPCLMCFFRDITERKQAQEALQREHHTLKHLLQSSDHERQLIAYEIHDTLAQQLAGALMQFDTFTCQKDSKSKQAQDAFHAGLTILRQSHYETRRLIAGVRPPILDESGVTEAIAHLVNEQGRLKGPKFSYFSEVDFDRLIPTLENSIYRIAQEGLTNACEHSQSEKVRVSLVQQEDWVRIEIRDWGIGFDTQTVRERHYGLEGIRQRSRLLGGKCKISSSPDKGTRIVVELPVVVREQDE